MWADLATIGGAILLGAFVVLIAGIALCSHFDAEYFGSDDTDCHP